MKSSVAVIIAMSGTLAGACTVCDSATGSALRAGIFDDSFWRTLLEVTAPFSLLGVVLFALDRYLPD